MLSMNQYRQYKHGSLFAMLLSIVLCNVSCSDDAGTEQPFCEYPSTRSVAVSLPLNTEATEINNLQVFIYNVAGTELLSEMEIIETEAKENGIQLVQGLIPSNSPAINNEELACRMVVLGNCPETNGQPESVESLTFNANDSQIPMIGSQEVQTHLDRNMSVMCATVNLLQSGALITVRLAESLTNAGIALGSAILKDVNKVGYCAPKQALKNNTSAEPAISDIYNPNVSSHGNLSLLAKEDGSMEALVPETSAPEAGPIELELQFTLNGEAYSGIFGQTLYLKNYADNVPFDIVRGHHYIFNIRSLQTEGDLEVIVEEWTPTTAEDVIFK